MGPAKAVEVFLSEHPEAERLCVVLYGSLAKTGQGHRTDRAIELAAEGRSIIFHEAPHKLRATLDDMCEIMGADRRIALCRELTKLNEEIIRTTLGGAVALYEEKEPRGEYVLVLEGTKVADGVEFWTNMTEREHVDFYMAQGMSKNEAIKAAAHDRGVHKSEIYKLVL
jgi:16S rRNA (cytidine1402-2'-O)-methyltransferase